MTYRERREARAERLREWAGKRESAAAAVHRSQECYRGDHAFNFQPANPNTSLARLRRRVNAQAERAFESEAKARAMSSSADEIERQAGRAIYSDDPDAIERLEARIAELEGQREAIKASNRTARREGREATPPYVLQNLTGNIGRQRKRLEALRRGPSTRERTITARYAGSCAACGAEITRGQAIRYSRAEGARCVQCPEEGAAA